MISLQRTTECPETLVPEEVAPKLEILRGKLEQSGTLNSKDFSSSVWSDFTIREILWNSQHRKCGYCEEPIPLKRTSDVDHYRPKAAVSDRPGHPGYWWLAYDWYNYIYSCRRCNQEYKKNKFPLILEESRVCEEGCINCEEPALINPFEHDPESYIAYSLETVEDQEYVFLMSNATDEHQRANKTREVCGLNRVELMKKRARELKEFIGILRTYENNLGVNNATLVQRSEATIASKLDPTLPFLGMKIFYLKQFDYGDKITEWCSRYG